MFSIYLKNTLSRSIYNCNQTLKLLSEIGEMVRNKKCKDKTRKMTIYPLKPPSEWSKISNHACKNIIVNELRNLIYISTIDPMIQWVGIGYNANRWQCVMCMQGRCVYPRKWWRTWSTHRTSCCVMGTYALTSFRLCPNIHTGPFCQEKLS